jgi:hypothetical protein
VPADPTAASLLARVTERYASARSYRDTGEQIVVHIRGPKPWHRLTNRKPFRTAFLRPDRFFFEYRDAGHGPQQEWQHSVLWTTRDGTRSWSTMDHCNVVQTAPLAQKLGVLAGVSGGTSLYAARLLGAHPGATSPLPRADSARIVEHTRHEERDCAIVEGLVDRGESVRVWIDLAGLVVLRQDLARQFDAALIQAQRAGLRRSAETMAESNPERAKLLQAAESMEHTPVTPFRSESTTIWHPELDVEIDASVFEFEPPG